MKYPDFGTLPYTSQPMKSDANEDTIFSFMTSDISGDFFLIINGISENGEYFNKSVPIKVRVN